MTEREEKDLKILNEPSMEQLKEQLAIYQTQELISNQRLFNQYLIQELAKLKEGMNQIIDFLNELAESKSEEQGIPKYTSVEKGIPEEDIDADIVATKKLLREKEEELARYKVEQKNKKPGVIKTIVTGMKGARKFGDNIQSAVNDIP